MPILTPFQHVGYDYLSYWSNDGGASLRVMKEAEGTWPRFETPQLDRPAILAGYLYRGKATAMAVEPWAGGARLHEEDLPDWSFFEFTFQVDEIRGVPTPRKGVYLFVPGDLTLEFSNQYYDYSITGDGRLSITTLTDLEHGMTIVNGLMTITDATRARNFVLHVEDHDGEGPRDFRPVQTRNTEQDTFEDPSR